MQKVTVVQNEPLIIVASNSALLSGSATLVSDIFTSMNYTTISGFVYSDQDSAANGFKIQQAMSRSDFLDLPAVGYYTEDTLTVTGGSVSNNNLSVPVKGNFVRIVYTNGVTAQAVFRLYVNLKND